MQRPEIALISFRKLHPNKRNSRTHSKKQIRQIANSIRRFGWTYPILTDENRVILAGHGRYYAALELGLREVPIIPVSGLSDAEKQALALADNKIAANAGWDRQLLAQELGELAKLLPKYDLDLEITGFETAEIDSLLGELVDPELDPADEVPSPKETVISKIGDLWELGPHRLLCGDAQSATDVRRLVGNTLAAMVITDPPYNLPIRKIQGRGRTSTETLRKAPVKCHRQNLLGFARRARAGGRTLDQRLYPFRVHGLASSGVVSPRHATCPSAPALTASHRAGSPHGR
jgi:hypothetical protein